METLKCVSRVDLTLYGSFADMVLVPNSRGNTGENTSLFVLTNPGQLHVYYDICFSSLTSKQDKNASIPVLRFPMAVSTIEPSMTVTKLSLVDKGGEFSTSLSEVPHMTLFINVHIRKYAYIYTTNITSAHIHLLYMYTHVYIHVDRHAFRSARTHT